MDKKSLDNTAAVYIIPGVRHSKGTVQAFAGTRKARFLAALRIAGTTMDQWAKENGTAQGYVSNLLSGRRVNAELNKKIDAFSAKQLAKVAA